MMEQKKDGWCGPAALSYALMKQGIEMSQEEIVKKTDTSIRDGVDPAPLVKIIRDLELQTKTFSGESAQETLDNIAHFLEFGYSCMVDYLAGSDDEDGHYVVVEDVEHDTIGIFDPSGGKKRSLKKDYFISHWKDFTEGGKILKHWAFCFKKLT